ncbi:MAG: ATP-dependent Clp protease ATP-binding subunit, partial [Clostridia bacterium]|nr:ATP-dependent Clp protease ATP-binding subunit [Clostridia bacterium]
MKRVTCSRCKQRPAVIFISKIIDGKTVPEGLCMNCAMEMNIGPIKQMMDSMGITEEDVDSISEQFSSMFPESDEEGGFESGGSPTMPFLQGLFGDLQNSLSIKNDSENTPEATS